MSEVAGRGAYLTDLSYPDLFHRETAPAWIAATVAAIGQRAPDLRRQFRYLDLGCGAGLTTSLLAAANSHASFVGVDFNAQHVARARARAASLANVAFVEADLAALPQRGAAAPFDAPFDFIVLHGVYSWVSPAVRGAIRQAIVHHLAPGGLLYLHYTSHPGQSVFAGAQAMLRRVAALAPGTPDARLRQALAAIAALDAGGAGYTVTYPEVARLLRGGGEQAAYLAHDLLAPDWAALHAGDVIEDMAAIGCHYVGSASVLDNVDALSLPGACLPMIAGIADLAARETARDLARNQRVRRDLYRRGLAGLPPAAYHAQLAGLRLQALPTLARGDVTVAMPIGPVTLDAAIAEPLRRRLCAGPATLAELAAAHPGGREPGMLLRAVLMLIAAGEIHAGGGGGQPPPPAFQRDVAAGGHLAAPAIGSAIAVAPAIDMRAVPLASALGIVAPD